jgi:hypothetical protein
MLLSAITPIVCLDSDVRLRGDTRPTAEGLSSAGRQSGGQSLPSQRQSLPRPTQRRLHNGKAAGRSQVRRMARGNVTYERHASRILMPASGRRGSL